LLAGRRIGCWKSLRVLQSYATPGYMCGTTRAR